MKPLLGQLTPQVLVLVLGLMVCLPSAYRIYHYLKFRHSAVAVYGVVDKPCAGGSGFGATPLVEFQDREGRRHVIKSQVKTHFFVAARKGEPIKVLFSAQAPETALVDSLFHYIMLPLIFAVIGAGAIAMALKNGWQAVKRVKALPA